jgi:hypothetical protein
MAWERVSNKKVETVTQMETEHFGATERIVTQLVKKFPAFYGTRNFHYRVHIMRRSPYSKPKFHMIHLNIILPSKPRSFKFSSFQAFQETFCTHLFVLLFVLHASHTSYSLRFDHRYNILWRVRNMELPLCHYVDITDWLSGELYWLGIYPARMGKHDIKVTLKNWTQNLPSLAHVRNPRCKYIYL